jgi:hypothetical protein
MLSCADGDRRNGDIDDDNQPHDGQDNQGRIAAHSFRSGLISRRMLSCADGDRRNGDIDDDYHHHDGQDKRGRIADHSFRPDITSHVVLRRW